MARKNVAKDQSITGDVSITGDLNVVGSISAGGGTQDPKDGVETVSTANVTLSGEQTINGVLTSTSRIGVVGQTAPAENGIYITAAGAWTRATDADEDAEVSNGLNFLVSGSGSTKSEFRYLLTTADPITIGATGLVFAEHQPGLLNVVEDLTPQQGGVWDSNSFQHRLSKGADIASAATLTPGTDGNYFDVTGTTTITAISELAVGTVIRLHFDAALILTHDAADLVLPTGADITTAADDEATFVQFAAGDWRCTEYQRADGTALAGSAGAGDSTTTSINQTAHGLSTEQWVRHNGTLYVLSIADAGANAEVYGVITEVTDVDNFVITTGGRATLSGLTAGLPHFLSDSVAGALTTSEPAISKPLFFADSTTTGFVINMRGFQSGLGGGGGIWEETQTESITSDTAFVDLDLDGTSKWWRIIIVGATPVSDVAGNNFDARVLVGGVLETGTVYRDVAERTSGASYSGQGSQGRAFMSLVPGVGGAAGESMMLEIFVANPDSTVDDKTFSGKGTYIHNDASVRKNTFSSSFNTQASAIDGLRVFFELSDIAKLEVIVHKMLGF